MELFGCLDCPPYLPLGLLCLILLLIYGYYPMNTWKRLGVPGPPSLPFIGHIHHFLNPKTGIRASVNKWQKQYGKVVGIQYFREPCLIVTDPDLFNEIFVREFNVYCNRFMMEGDFVPKVLLNGLAFNRGKDWKRNRKITTPTFTGAKLKLLTGHMNITSRVLARKLQENAKLGEMTIAKNVFGSFSLDVAAGTVFGLEINSLDNENNVIYQKMKAIFTPKKSLKLALLLAGIFPFMGKFIKKLGVSLFDPDSVEYFISFLQGLIDDRKKQPEQFEKWDFLKLLLNAEAEDDDGGEIEELMLTPDEVVCNAISFIAASYESSSSTLQFLTHILARNHDVQDKLHAEIKSVFSDSELSSEDFEVTYDHCQKLKYMEAVLQETLRMFPPVHLLLREATKDTTLAGFQVPKNTGILIPVYNIGRDPKLFKNPNNFHPERFLDKSTSPSFKPIHFLSFGFGPRNCMGYRLALMVMKIALVHVLTKVRIQNVQPTEMIMQDYTGFLIPKEPVKITMSLRT